MAEFVKLKKWKNPDGFIHDKKSTKVCSKCGDEKNIDEFRLRSETPDGHVAECRSCEADRRDEKRSQKKNDKMYNFSF